MTVRVHALEDSRSILVSYDSPYEPIEDVLESLRLELDILKTMSVFPVYVIVDISRINMSFADITSGLAVIGKSDEGKAIANFDLRILHIGNGQMVQLGASGLRQEQYGGLDVHVFSTLEEAKMYIQEQIRQETNSNTPERVNP